MTTEQLVPAPDPSPQRRVAVLPLVLAAVGVLAAIVFACVVAGLAGVGTPQPTPTVAGTSAAPSAPAGQAAETPATTQPRREAGPDECVDELGDGAIDIDSAGVAEKGGLFVTGITIATPLPDGDATLGIFAVNDAGDVIYQLAATWRDGDLDEFFTQRFGIGQGDDNRGRGNRDDDSGAQTTDLDEENLDFDGTTMVASFPKDVLRDLGSHWSWYAFTAVDGVEVDACPGQANSRETMPFVG